ncbi:MAG: pinensin family lanthipeptide [Cyclobacteriaceae bacterium]
MKKLNLSDLKVSSFTTEKKKSVKGGACETEFVNYCPYTEALRTCLNPCGTFEPGCGEGTMERTCNGDESIKVCVM